MKRFFTAVLIFVFLIAPFQVFAQSKAASGYDYSIFLEEFKKRVEHVEISFYPNTKGQAVRFKRFVENKKIDLTDLSGIEPGVYSVNLRAYDKTYTQLFFTDTVEVRVEAGKISNIEKPVFKLGEKYTYTIFFSLDKEIFQNKNIYSTEIISADKKQSFGREIQTLSYKGNYWIIKVLDLKIRKLRIIVYKKDEKTGIMKKFISESFSVSPFFENEDYEIILGDIDFQEDPNVVLLGGVSFDAPVFIVE